jgi:hypothetical protein
MQVIVSGTTINQAVVIKENNQVVVQQPLSQVVELSVPGAQGPAFAGQQLFNVSAIEALSVVNSGVTLKWDGNQFVPADELGEGLTVFGGAF